MSDTPPTLGDAVSLAQTVLRRVQLNLAEASATLHSTCIDKDVALNEAMHYYNAAIDALRSMPVAKFEIRADDVKATPEKNTRVIAPWDR